jgi:hypothetical protein
MYDPYGYYKARNEYSLDKNPNVPFYNDYPVEESEWFLGTDYVNLGKTYIPDGALEAQVNPYDTSKGPRKSGPELTLDHPTANPNPHH